MPFRVNVDTVSYGCQMETTDLRCGTDSRNTFRCILNRGYFKSLLHADQFPVFSDRARRITGLFGSTYSCEQFFSRMKATTNER
jgi:hypothetical protein